MSELLKVISVFTAPLGLLLMIGVWQSGTVVMSGGKTLFALGFLLFMFSVGQLREGFAS